MEFGGHKASQRKMKKLWKYHFKMDLKYFAAMRAGLVLDPMQALVIEPLDSLTRQLVYKFTF
jgi:hypothetical protein